MKKGLQFSICLAVAVTLLDLLSSTVADRPTAKQQTQDVLKAGDGHKLAEWHLENIPVFDSMVEAWERLHWRMEKSYA